MMSVVIAALIFLIAGVALLIYAWTVPSSQILWAGLVRGPAKGRAIALTFDDGPAPPFTEQILDILRHHQAPATFFVCGKNVERFPEVIRRIQEEGHALGNHTYSHPFLFFCGRSKIADEIDRTQEAIEKVTGYRPAIFRPPYGIRWFGLSRVLSDRGMKLIQWSDTGFDWKYQTDAIVRAALRNLVPGAVILLHDGQEILAPGAVNRSRTVKALPAILEGIRRAGFNLVTIPELLSETTIAPAGSSIWAR